MSDKSINAIKAALLREAVQARGLSTTKTSVLSKIYPATDHGPNHPPRRVDLKSMPEVDHKADDKADAKEDEKAEVEPHLPNLDRVHAREVMMNLRATSFTAPKPPVKQVEDRGPKFVRRCVAAITGATPPAPPVAEEVRPAQECCGDEKDKAATPHADKFLKAMAKFKTKKPGHG